ncbi:MAG TPA: ATP-binding protein [Planctomycetota bacterium]|jgi:signal transduction histidine kinase|nr:ATP-binding protein [Planctomycetota bacterium]
MQESTAGLDASPPVASLEDERAHRARLEQAGRLLAEVVHEINNPLAVIQGYTQLLLERARDPEDRRDLACVLDEARRLGTLVEDMLSFARRGGPEIETVDLRRVVSSTLNLTTHAMRQARVSLVASLPDRDLLVRGQHGAYVQVLLNLLTNARQSLEAGRREGRGIALRLEPAAAGLVRLVVSNNGPPIPAELAERVFEPFFTTRPPGEGSGLGLALCRQILARYGGAIVLEPTSADEGTSFRIEIPQA